MPITPPVPRLRVIVLPSTSRLLRLAGIALGIAWLTGPTRVAAQSVDSLTASLFSTDLLVRGAAVEALARLPLTALPSVTRDALVALLEREATGTQSVDPQQPGDAHESWSEYIIGLADLVQTLGDSRSLRGLALLGIQTSRATQEFVASFGDVAIGPLAEAWATKPDARPSVITTWAIIARSADPATQAVVLQRLLAPDDTFPVALADAAVAGNLTGLVPFLDSLAQSGALIPIVRGAVEEAATALRPAFEALSATALLEQYVDLLSGICLNAKGALRGYCQSSTNGLENSLKHLLRGQAPQVREEVGKVIRRTMEAVSSGVLTPTQANVFVAGLGQTLLRIM